MQYTESLIEKEGRSEVDYHDTNFRVFMVLKNHKHHYYSHDLSDLGDSLPIYLNEEVERYIDILYL